MKPNKNYGATQPTKQHNLRSRTQPTKQQQLRSKTNNNGAKDDYEANNKFTKREKSYDAKQLRSEEPYEATHTYEATKTLGSETNYEATETCEAKKNGANSNLRSKQNLRSKRN